MGQYPGKCKCGLLLYMMITPLDDDNKKVIGWIIYGVCKKCEEALIMDISKDVEKQVQDRDFIIDWDKVAKGKLKWK